jgi:hypothetical protein
MLYFEDPQSNADTDTKRVQQMCKNSELPRCQHHCKFEHFVTTLRKRTKPKKKHYKEYTTQT